MKNSFLIFIVFFLFLSCSKQEDQKPNVLFILADDLGYEKISSYGGLEVQTRNIDALANEGVKFTRAYTSPVCTPSRMSIYTGQYAPTHGYTQVIPIHKGSRHAVDFQKLPTYIQLIDEAGYYTAVTGKWQLAALEYHSDHCKQAGFDSWCVWQIWDEPNKTKRYWNHTYNLDGEIVSNQDSIFGPDLMAKYVIEQMATAKKKNQPFYIHHNMVLPHVPIVSTPADLNDGEDKSLNKMIQYMDYLVGGIVDALDSLELADNTYVIFAGDNGTQSKIARRTNKGEVTGGKWQMNDAGFHVPLIVRAPNQTNQFASDALIDFADFYPTILDLLNIQIPNQATIDGQSFANVMDGKTSNRNWVTGGINSNFMVFDGAWRLDYRDSVLVDCRDLPHERSVLPPFSEEEQQAYDRLLNQVSRLGKNFEPVQFY